ncbi:MAG: arsenic resistance N-acetyltransferase ArsN2 [Candidatus Heimdallarchaeota archaeon]
MEIKELEFETAAPNHLSSVLSLLKRFKLPVEDVESQLANFVVLRNQDQIVGCAGLEVYGSIALLRSVAVHPDWQGRSLGKQLVDHMMNRAHNEGVERVYLLTETGKVYFQKFGFRSLRRDEVDDRIKKTEEFTKLCPESSIPMVRDLTPVFASF